MKLKIRGGNNIKTRQKNIFIITFYKRKKTILKMLGKI